MISTYEAAVALCAEYAPDLLPERERARLHPVSGDDWASTRLSGQIVHGLDLDEFLARTEAGIPWLVDGLIATGGITVFAGDPRSFKTTAALQLMFAVASGSDWLGHPLRLSGPVAYVGEEGSAHALSAQYRAFRALTPPQHPILTYHLQGLSPTRSEGWSQFVAEIRAAGVVLVVIDTLARTMEGDENDAAAMREYLAPLAELLRDGITVVLVHHFNKGGGDGRVGKRMRGSSALWGAVDGTLGFTRPTEGGRPLDDVVIAAETKYGEPETIRASFAPSVCLIVGLRGPILSPAGVAAVLREMEADQGAIPFRLLQARYPWVGEDKLRATLNEAIALGLVRSEGRGKNTCYRAVREEPAFEPFEEVV